MFFLIDPEEILAKGVSGLRSALTRIENEIKHHQQPKSPIDAFGDKLTVSFHYQLFLLYNLKVMRAFL